MRNKTKIDIFDWRDIEKRWRKRYKEEWKWWEIVQLNSTNFEIIQSPICMPRRLVIILFYGYT